MDSTIGTARGSTHGSWRPRAARVAASPSRVTVCCSEAMVDVGLNATLTTMSSPLEMPPCTPPERFDTVRIPSEGSVLNGSLWDRPVRRVPLKPLPISNPLAAGRDSIAPARAASSLSNTGSPRPAGTPRQTHSTTPPRESPSRRAPSMASTIRSAATGSGQRVGPASTSSRVIAVGSAADSMSRTDCTHPSTSTPAAACNSLRAIAAAATRPTVSRAEARPPPVQSRKPYLAS